jgi:hypothetical protein
MVDWAPAAPVPVPTALLVTYDAVPVPLAGAAEVPEVVPTSALGDGVFALVADL